MRVTIAVALEASPGIEPSPAAYEAAVLPSYSLAPDFNNARMIFSMAIGAYTHAFF